jgi:TRAP-type uncharacterized transport system substrate-binding protein
MRLSKTQIFQVSVAVLLIAGLALTVLVTRSGLQRTLVMATGPAGSAYEQYAEQYRILLAHSGVELQLQSTGGTVENLRLLDDPATGIDVAFLSSGTTSADESPDIRALGTIFLEEVWFFSRNPDLAGGDLAALRGKRMSIGPEGSATRAVAQALIRLNGIDPASAEFLGLAPQQAAAQLRRGDIDAAMIMTSADSPLVRELLADPAIGLVSFRRAGAYVARYPFLTKLTVPEGVGDLALNRPPHDVTTFGAPVSLAVRADMYPALQALLLDAATQIHAGPGMFNAAGRFPAAQAIDLPLSDAALQYYKAGLPFLQRYLPFGIAVVVGRLLFIVIPLIGVLYPVLRLAPALFGWAMRHRIFRLYGELKFLEHELGSDPGDERRRELRDQLEQLDRRVGRMHVPLSYSQMVYTLRLHINLVRSRLAPSA